MFGSALREERDSGLKPRLRELAFYYGGYSGKDNEISMMTRSMLQIMLELATIVQVPVSDVTSGRAAPGAVEVSYGLQAGVQVFGYALFFMNDGALEYLDSSGGFELGVGPSIVVVDAGMGKSITSTTITQDVYAFIFSQKGLMAGIGLQGSKITRISK